MSNDKEWLDSSARELSPLESPLFIPVVLGSIRRNRRSARPAQLLAQRVEAAGHRTELLDLRATVRGEASSLFALVFDCCSCSCCGCVFDCG